jgi:Tfp pilus assembly major pilin PilA
MYKITSLNHVRNEKGVSLMELLIIMALLTILSAIAVPSYYGFKEQAAFTNMLTTCKNAVPEIQGWYANSMYLNMPFLGLHNGNMTCFEPLDTLQTCAAVYPQISSSMSIQPGDVNTLAGIIIEHHRSKKEKSQLYPQKWLFTNMPDTGVIAVTEDGVVPGALKYECYGKSLNEPIYSLTIM